MNNIILTELPTMKGFGNNSNKNIICWDKTVGMDIKVLYENKEYNIYIHSHNKQTQTLEITIDIEPDIKYLITTCNFKNCKLKNFVSERFYKWLLRNNTQFEIDYEKNLKELSLTKDHIDKLTYASAKQIYIKCNICGSSILRNLTSITNNIKCGVCDNQIIVKGINDIATTHPHLVKYFVNINDTYNYSYGSSQKILARCLICSHLKEIRINQLFNYELNKCEMCSDGISYPEKLMRNILNALKIQYKTQYRPKWCRYDYNGKVKNGVYDFYLEKYNTIIETDGAQHGKKEFYLSIEDQKYIDEQKDLKAKENNLTVLRINCFKSNVEWIKNSILSHEFFKQFPIDKIDWNKCAIESESNIMLDVCNLFNNGIVSPKQISEKYGLNITTIHNWLNRGTSIGLCNYNGKESIGQMRKTKKIINIDTNEVFDSFQKASIKYGVSRGNIRSSCINGFKCGGYNWRYYNE